MNGRNLAAAQWVERSADGLTAEQARLFETWYGEPEHAQAFDSLERDRASIVSLIDREGLGSLYQETLDRLESNSTRRSRIRKIVAVAAAIVLTAPLTYLALRPLDRVDAVATSNADVVYKTGIGQTVVLTLSDGSRVMLNTDSEVSVDFSAHERRLRLAKGEAMFEVAKDATRPFTVAAGRQVVTAHGTAFNVRVTADQVHVVLVEGKVSVTSPAGNSVAMLPNDVLISRKDQTALYRRAMTDETLSWKDGFIVFDDQPLASAIAEVNRYTSRQLVLGDQLAAGLRVSGSFRTDDVESFVSALESEFAVRIKVLDDGSRQIVSDPAKK